MSVGWQVFRPAPLGFRELGLATTLEDDAVAYFFRKVVSLSHVECLDDFKISFQRDDGAVIYVNGDEIGRSNMPAGPVNFITEASSGLNNAAETEVVSLTVNGSYNPFKAGLNVIGVSVHQVRTPDRVLLGALFCAVLLTAIDRACDSSGRPTTCGLICSLPRESGIHAPHKESCTSAALPKLCRLLHLNRSPCRLRRLHRQSHSPRCPSAVMSSSRRSRLDCAASVPWDMSATKSTNARRKRWK